MAYTDLKQNRTVAIGSVVLVHAAIGAALLSGLAVKFTPKTITIIEGENIPIDPPPPPDEPPPPEVKVERPPTTPPINAPVPLVRRPVETPIDTTPVIYPLAPYTPPVIETGPPASIEPLAAPPVSLARGAQVRGDQGGWFPQDSYPAAARRAGAEGRVSVSVDVGATGRVLACRVVGSSGNDDLDQATCRLATRNGRFDPARDAAGEKTGSTVTLRPVRWMLEN